MDNSVGVIVAMVVFAAANWGGFVGGKSDEIALISWKASVFRHGCFGLTDCCISQWTSNDNNLYSAALAIINIKPGLTSISFQPYAVSFLLLWLLLASKTIL